MIDFKNYPPRQPDDVSISEAGKLAIRTIQDLPAEAAIGRLRGIGLATYVQLANAVDETQQPGTHEFRNYKDHLIGGISFSNIASEAIGYFTDGFEQGEEIFTNQVNTQEVAA